MFLWMEKEDFFEKKDNGWIVSLGKME